jgi:hypothetical protein
VTLESAVDKVDSVIAVEATDCLTFRSVSYR